VQFDVGKVTHVSRRMFLVPCFQVLDRVLLSAPLQLLPRVAGSFDADLRSVLDWLDLRQWMVSMTVLLLYFMCCSSVLDCGELHIRVGPGRDS
jgi:hypothetical protein